MFKFSSYLEQQNKNGDDALYIKEIGSSIWFCISDGAGGTGQGAHASAYIIEVFEELTRIDGIDAPEDFESFLRKVDIELLNESQGSEATAIVGKVMDGIIVGASVGDSEAWIFNLEYDYELTSMQYLKPLIGSGKSVPIGFGPMYVEKNVLLGSDGLFNYVNRNDIKSLLSSDCEAIQIADLAKKEKGSLQDDVSVIFISSSPYEV
jgi:PPM family protein phosphatase